MEWYRDWQHLAHAESFDGRSRLDRRNLIRNLEGFNDVRLLNERLGRDRRVSLLEVGCATGEFYRYLRVSYPGVRYYGVDVSAPAVARAKQKYPQAAFFVTDPAMGIGASLRASGIPEHPEIVYAKDVVPHQVRPFAFLAELIQTAAEAVIVRCRTRDRGTSELDPERSCQYHYDGWMPYLVLNLQELIDRLAAESPGCEVVAYRSHVVLGGRHNRFVPKELYLRETGTAETAVGVFKRTDHPGRVLIEDRPDQNPAYTWDYRLRHAARQALNAFTGAA